jgi:hypothetical protein
MKVPMLKMRGSLSAWGKRMNSSIEPVVVRTGNGSAVSRKEEQCPRAKAKRVRAIAARALGRTDCAKSEYEQGSKMRIRGSDADYYNCHGC